ncbi:Baseplate assembly protein domain-containing protein [Desulfonema magnum]|uniref:Baseplate assembly protein domain-containing protein n=2 Tax=Desulfonema magnum TaxID=45655 RepID=A0A975BNR7_9BACT|nr:Baseplate assembly protein domain-containing protein [Desulfonema magnum]
MGIDYVNVKKDGDGYKLFLYFIPSASDLPDRKTVPDAVTPASIRISDYGENKASSDILVRDVVNGKWERSIEPVIDSALNLDGKTKINCGNKINLADKSFTVEFWARRESAGKHHIIIGQGPPAKNAALKIGFKDTGCFTFGFSGDDLDTENTWSDTDWHHWACVYEAAPKRQTIYRDGKIAARRYTSDHYHGCGYLYLGSGSSGGLFFNAIIEEAPETVRIWNRARTRPVSNGFLSHTDDFFHGAVADIRIWNKARTQDGIIADMYHRLTGREARLMAYWMLPARNLDLSKFGKAVFGSGKWFDSKEITVADISKNGNSFKCPKSFLCRMDQPPLPQGYIVKQEGSRVDLYQEEDVLTIAVSRENQIAQEKEGCKYRLELPEITNLDPFFSQITFDLNEESEFDPEPPPRVEPKKGISPDIDYLTKDYESFRKLMFYRMSALAPNWTERNPADMGVAITEVLAYMADHLSYFQDAVSTEAYLGTARRRVSLARHARLIDYRMHEGCNARVWVQVEVESDTELEKGTVLITKTPGRDVCVSNDTFIEEMLPTGPKIFETMHPVSLFKDHNRLSFYTWGGNITRLRKGAIQAALSGNFPNLQAGDVLIFEEVKGVLTGLKEDAEPNRRHAVRLTKVRLSSDLMGGADGEPAHITNIQWAEADALPFDFYIASAFEGTEISDITTALGNVVLADHGRTIRGESLPEVPPTGKYRPQLERINLTCSVPYDHFSARQLSAQETLDQNPRTAGPLIWLTEQDTEEAWTAQNDFFNCDRFVRGFVAETENDRRVFLRFGDGSHGKIPLPATCFSAAYRIGNGSAGNIGRDAIAHVITAEKAIIRVRNPLSAYGGTDPEKMNQVRLQAPQAFRTQERCITPEDYVRKIESHPEVQRAAASVRWTGSWHTVFIAVDRVGDNPSDAEFCKRLSAFMKRFRIVGADMRIEPPRFVPLDIAMTVSVLPGYFPGTVEKSLEEKFSNVEFSDGRLGLFHPDNFSFGQSVYLSHLMTEAGKVPGVGEIRFTRFQRWDRPSGDEIEEGEIAVGPLEIVRLDNNIEAPGNGRILFEMSEVS